MPVTTEHPPPEWWTEPVRVPVDPLASVIRRGGAVGLAIRGLTFPIIPAILLLFTPRARRSARTFLAGWVIGIAVATRSSSHWRPLHRVGSTNRPPGVLDQDRPGRSLLVLAALRWRRRREQQEAAGWMKSIEQHTPVSALRLGLLLSAANPKILMLTIAAGLTIGAPAERDGDPRGSSGFLTLLAASHRGAPGAGLLVVDDPVLRPLSRVRTWLQETAPR